jgi:hypothetical protein
MMQHLSTFLAILNDPPPFNDPNDKTSCESILRSFSKTEVEEIANTSYVYWIVSTKIPEKLPQTAKENSALKEIRRHYVGEGRNATKAAVAIAAALKHRREYRIDLLRSCFYEVDYKSDMDKELSTKYKSLIFQDLERQPMVVQGTDCHGRTIVYKPPRSSNPVGADEAFFLTQLYSAERAIAVSEFQRQHKEEKLCVIFNFKNYSSFNSPSKSTLVKLVKVLQNCYPERLGILTILEPPFWMRALFNIVWPFLSRATTEKIKVSGDVLVDLLNIEDGSNNKLKAMIARPDTLHVDLVEYTQQPFYCGEEQSCLDM